MFLATLEMQAALLSVAAAYNSLVELHSLEVNPSPTLELPAVGAIAPESPASAASNFPTLAEFQSYSALADLSALPGTFELNVLHYLLA